MKIARWALLSVFVLAAGTVSAQAQQPAADQPSSADAAKKSGDEKPKRPRVWDNDTIPKAGDEISVVGQTTATPTATDATNADPNAAAAAATAAPAAPIDSGSRKAVDREESSKAEKDLRLARAKEKVESLKKDLDLLQRKVDLDAQMYFSKPDYASDKAGAQNIQDERDAITAKQVDVDAAQKELDELQAELEK